MTGKWGKKDKRASVGSCGAGNESTVENWERSGEKVL